MNVSNEQILQTLQFEYTYSLIRMLCWGSGLREILKIRLNEYLRSFYKLSFFLQTFGVRRSIGVDPENQDPVQLIRIQGSRAWRAFDTIRMKTKIKALKII